jgi:uncharacterized protein YgiM (DUF1202 family)
MQSVRLKYVYLFMLLLCSIVLSSEKQVEVTNFFAKLYLAPSINSKFMGLAQKGEKYTILLSSNFWYRIDFKGVPVWVENSNIQVFDPDAPPAAKTENIPEQNQNVAPTTSPEISDSQPSSSSSLTASTSTTGNTNVSTTLPTSGGQPTRFENKRESFTREQDSIKQSSRLRRWISRENFSRLPIIEQNFEEERKDKFFLVTTSPAKVLLVLSPDSPILGMVNRGEHLQLIGEGESWCKVSYKDTVGWIERKDGRVVTSTSFPIFLNFGTIIIIAAVILLILLIFAIAKLLNRKAAAKPVASENKKALIIARESKTVMGTLTNTSTSMDKCFVEIGFETRTTADLQNVKSCIDTYAPDVVLIDWRFDRTIINSVEGIFTSSPRANSIVVVIYNVPDPTSMFANPALPRMAFLGISFSDRDLFKVVTPLMVTSEAAQMSQKNDQTSALEGEIAGGNLIEVMQYIEIGTKTGCLIIETGKPFCLIYFNMGSIIYAATSEGLIGREALYASLNLEVGKFKFLLNKKPKSSNANLSTLEVLMSWTKNLDETLKH